MSCSKTIAAVATLFLFAGLAPAQQYTREQIAAHKKLYHEAVAERDAGRLAAAELKARQLARARPGDPYVRRLLVQIQNQRRELRERPQWERLLQTIIVPKVEIDGASLAEVLEYVRAKAEAGSGGRGAPSFVVRGEGAGGREVTLSLRNVPLSEVLRYAGELSDVRFTYEKYAIVANDLRPALARGPEPAPPAAPDGPAAPEAPDAEGGEFPGVLNFRAPSVASSAGSFPG